MIATIHINAQFESRSNELEYTIFEASRKMRKVRLEWKKQALKSLIESCIHELGFDPRISKIELSDAKLLELLK